MKRAGFVLVWILGGIATQVRRDAHAGYLGAKALWHEWMRTYWPRIYPVVRASLFAVGVSARSLVRAGHQAGRTIAIGVRNGIEEGGHRYRESLELGEYPAGTTGWWQVRGRVERDRRVRADGYRERGDQIHGDAIQTREEKAAWARAATLGELGEVTARWAEGKVNYHPNGYDEGPDEETTGLIPALAALNRFGFVTSCSQPGVGPQWGFDNRVWWQRAAVDGYTDPDTAARLEKLCGEAGLIFINNGRAGWRTHWRNAVDVTASPVAGAELTGAELNDDSHYVPHTHFGTHMSRRAVKFDFDGHGYHSLVNAEQVTIIDPVWGRNDLLWHTLTGHTPPATETLYSADEYGRRDGEFRQGYSGLRFDELGQLYGEASGRGNYVRVTDWHEVPPRGTTSTATPGGDVVDAGPLAVSGGHEQPRATRRWDGEPETAAETRFFDLRESGYQGWIDQDGYPAACPSCGEMDCTKGLTEHYRERNPADEGDELTNIEVGAAVADNTTTQLLRQFYEQAEQSYTQLLDSVAMCAQAHEALASNTEAVVGNLHADEHPPSTIACATVFLSGALDIQQSMEADVRRVEAQIAAARNGIQNLESARAMEQAHDAMTAAVGGPARNTDAYRQS